MPRSHTQKRLAANWINIVLTIISVTQGVVIGFLLGQFPNTIATRSPIVLVLFLLCLVISLRVFQTFITGVLDDEFTMPNLYEFFIVFIVVSIEYYLFTLVGKASSGNVDALLNTFYKWGMALCFVAAIGYSFKLWRLKRRFKQHHKRRDDYYYTQVWLQRRNVFGMVALMAIQIFLICSSSGIFNFALSGNWHIPLVFIMIAILFANINYSLRATFGENVQMSKPAQLAKPEGEKIEIKIVQARRDDVTELRNLLMQHFGYVYKALFGTGKKNELVVSKMLEAILKALGGKHALGYKSFCIAYPKGRSREIVGMLKLKSSVERWSGFLTALSIINLVFLNFGLRGLLRVWRNWRAIRNVSRQIGANELHIVYLAVSDNARKRQVGRQLLEHARQVAKDKDKKIITLCVRENNSEGKGFFRHQGFFIETFPNHKADNKTDNLLGQGPIVCMSGEL